VDSKGGRERGRGGRERGGEGGASARMPMSARTKKFVRVDAHGQTQNYVRAVACARPQVKPRPRVNADAGGRPVDLRGCLDEKDVRTDIFIQNRPL
jgi:hypothetical protein